MSSAWGNLIGALTLLIMLTFIAIWLWAWLPHHKQDFDALSRLPMSDDSDPDDSELGTTPERAQQ
ncbi:MAG TPA: cbb3-type cytochrome c oxidase subunit 3 [Steroidobacteraceae bacterium]|jgi:cytochrome c oxidase cbb3-type subunit 4